MEKIVYHINPNTGVPNVCRAKKGNCPYGGADGTENHFDTFSEAQKYAEEMMASKYKMLPTESSEDVMSEIEKKRRISKKQMDKLLKSDDILKEINTTKNQHVIVGVIEGELEKSGHEYLAAALQNPNLSNNFVKSVLINQPEEFDDETRKFTAGSHQLTHEELVHVIENDKNDEVRAVALMNKNIDRDYIRNILETKSDDELMKPPYSIIFSDWRNRKNELANEVKDRLRSKEGFTEMSVNGRRIVNKYTPINERMYLTFNFN